MKSESLIKNYRKITDSGESFVFTAYAVFLLVFYFAYVYLLNKNPDFFLMDDGYYTCGKALYEGKISFLHQSRGPGLYILFAGLNVIPESLHPITRVIMTIAVMRVNIFFASRIFGKMLTKTQLFWGLAISVFNPLTLHFTIKNTPEIYLTLIMGVIIFGYLKFIDTNRYIFFVLAAAGILSGMIFKPVFFLIPIFMLLHNVFIIKNKKYYLLLVVLALVSFYSYSLFQTYTKLEDEKAHSYGFGDILARVYLYDAMMKSGEINLGTSEEIQYSGADKSNYVLCDRYWRNWIEEYKKTNNDAPEYKIALDFTKDNLFRSVLLRITSPVLFISLTASTIETVLYAFLYGWLTILSVLCIRKIIKDYKKEISAIIYVLMGYGVVFFLTLSYARYSIPFMFFFLIFTGIYFSKIIDRLLLNHVQEQNA